MNAQFLVFKGAPRWRDRSFWIRIAILSALLGWNVYRGHPLWPVLIWSPFFGLTPHRLYLGKNWLVCLNPLWMFCQLQRFERIENYSVWDAADEENASVSLTLLRVKGPRARHVSASIQKGAQLDAFVAAMETRGVPSLQKHLENTLADLPNAVFSPPFASIEAEREALYRLLNRPMPKI